MRVELSVCASLKVFGDGKYSRADRRNPHIVDLTIWDTELTSGALAAHVHQTCQLNTKISDATLNWD